jgi:hypothetical protein
MNSKLHGLEESAFAESGLRTIQVPASVEVLCKSCFGNCESLTSGTFELNSKPQRIDESTFAGSGLKRIQVPASVEMLCKSRFSNCRRLASVTFESPSKLREAAAIVLSGRRIDVGFAIRHRCPNNPGRLFRKALAHLLRRLPTRNNGLDEIQKHRKRIHIQS